MLNVLNPQPCQWKDLATVVQRYYDERGLTVAGVALGEWLASSEPFDEAKAAEMA